MKARCKSSSRERGGALRWVVLLLAVATFVIGTVWNRKSGPPVPPPQLTARTPQTPAEAPVAPVAPEPEPAAAPAPPPAPVPEPTPPPAAAATPMPAPAEPTLDIATLAASPALWPPAVALVQPFPFPVVIEGRVVGKATAPVGTMLRVLRVNGQQVEVEFQKARHIVPASVTDLVQRALEILKNGRPAPLAAERATATPPAMSAAAPRAPAIPVQPARTPESADAARLAKQITVEPVAKLATVMSNGYYSKRDDFTLKLKFSNSDARTPAENLKAEIYIFGESLLDPDLLSLLAVEQSTFTVPAHGNFEIKTAELRTTYDNSGSYRSGTKFGAWFLRVRSSTGDLVLVKTNSTTLQKIADKVTGLRQGATYNRKTLKESKTRLQ